MTTSYERNKRWRKKHPRKWLEMKRRYYRQFQEGAYNKNQEWTIEDIDIILNKKITDRRISVLIGRSVGAIQAERGRWKKRLRDPGIRGSMAGSILRLNLIKSLKGGRR
jgi:hypothetical protein